MTGSKELARSVLFARNVRWACAAAVPVASIALAATTIDSASNFVHDIFSGQSLSWDLAKGPAVSAAVLVGSQFPSFLANNHMVNMAKEENSDLARTVLNAASWRRRKREAEFTGLFLSPTFIPGGLWGSVFSGIPLAVGGVIKIGEMVENSHAHHGAKRILHSGAARRVLSTA